MDLLYTISGAGTNKKKTPKKIKWKNTTMKMWKGKKASTHRAARPVSKKCLTKWKQKTNTFNFVGIARLPFHSFAMNVSIRAHFPNSHMYTHTLVHIFMWMTVELQSERHSDRPNIRYFCGVFELRSVFMRIPFFLFSLHFCRRHRNRRCRFYICLYRRHHRCC